MYWWSLIAPLNVCWWYLCVLSKYALVAKNTRWLDVCQAYAESHGIIFNYNKTVCMTFKAKTAKSTVIPLLTLGVLTVKFVSHLQIIGNCITYWVFRWQRHSERTAISILCSNASFSFQCRTQLKMILFRSFCRSMHVS